MWSVISVFCVNTEIEDINQHPPINIDALVHNSETILIIGIGKHLGPRTKCRTYFFMVAILCVEILLYLNLTFILLVSIKYSTGVNKDEILEFAVFVFSFHGNWCVDGNVKVSGKYLVFYYTHFVSVLTEVNIALGISRIITKSASQVVKWIKLEWSD